MENPKLIIDSPVLIQAINEAFGRQSATLRSQLQQDGFVRRLAELTPREREVMELVIAGRHNREIARTLGISARTVEVHKARMMAKLGTSSIPQLVRISLGVADSP